MQQFILHVAIRFVTDTIRCHISVENNYPDKDKSGRFSSWPDILSFKINKISGQKDFCLCLCFHLAWKNCFTNIHNINILRLLPFRPLFEFYMIIMVIFKVQNLKISFSLYDMPKMGIQIEIARLNIQVKSKSPPPWRLTAPPDPQLIFF